MANKKSLKKIANEINQNMYMDILLQLRRSKAKEQIRQHEKRTGKGS